MVDNAVLIRRYETEDHGFVCQLFRESLMENWIPAYRLVHTKQGLLWSSSSLGKVKFVAFMKYQKTGLEIIFETFTLMLFLIRRVVNGSAPLASPTQGAIIIAAFALSPSFLAFLAVELITQVTLSDSFSSFISIHPLLLHSTKTSFQSALLAAIYYIYWAYYRCPRFVWPTSSLQSHCQGAHGL